MVELEQASCCGVVQSPSVEDALRTIYVRAGRGEQIRTSALAQHLNVTPPSASAMLKRLAAHGLVDRGPDHQIALTAHGADHARDVVRRHRLLETFLAMVLGLTWDEVHVEADLLEHAVSDRLLARIDEYLKHPARDPHGDPIPRPGTQHEESWSTPLASAPVGCRFLVERVFDDDGAALRYLAKLGIHPGVTVQLTKRQPFGGPLWIRVDDDREHALGEQLLGLVHGRVTS
ncbi:metal-dependent transcriptional regulator [Pseudonocardia hispaniensis]|uniref:Manganese transport regulator n=1 Tax=Pseudonocardia hispaniensis TaxID=904933 RepID=A0ABW1J463_9PSEU